MDGLDPAEWHDFFTVAGTAVAALLGLVLVAISLRVEVVEQHPILRNRARGALQTLGGLLILSLIALIPHIGGVYLGMATLALDLALVVLTAWGLVSATRGAGRLPGSVWLRSTPNVLVLLSIAGAISLVVDRGPGIYLIAAAVILVLAPMLFSVWGLLFAPELRRRS